MPYSLNSGRCQTIDSLAGWLSGVRRQRPPCEAGQGQQRREERQERLALFLSRSLSRFHQTCFSLPARTWSWLSYMCHIHSTAAGVTHLLELTTGWLTGFRRQHPPCEASEGHQRREDGPKRQSALAVAVLYVPYSLDSSRCHTPVRTDSWLALRFSITARPLRSERRSAPRRPRIKIESQKLDRADRFVAIKNLSVYLIERHVLKT